MKSLIYILPFLILLQAGKGQPVKTIENLKRAYQDEATSARQYDLYSHKAEKEKQPEVAKLFRAISKSESVHMQNHQKVLTELGIQVPTVTFGEIKVLKTEDNLKMPIQSERTESLDYYPKLIKEAEEENVPAAVMSFSHARNVGRQHQQLLRQALFNYNKMPATDYYVSDTTGEIVAIPQGTTSDNPKLRDKNFVKVN